MATLKTNTLTGTSTAGSIAVTGEGNSTTTNLQQGLCKVWCHWDNNTAIQDSFNVSGITDDQTGVSIVAYSNNMANDDYAGGGLSRLNSGGGTTLIRIANVFSTSQIKIACVDNSDSLSDGLTQSFVLNGDLA